MSIARQIVAGNPARLSVTFAAPDGGDVNPVTAVACWTPGNRVGGAETSTALTPAVTYGAGDTSVTVVAVWQVADDQAPGVYTMTVDIAGSLIAAYQVAFTVVGRVEPAVP